MGPPLFPTVFWCDAPKPASMAPSPCLNLAASSTWSLRRITELVVHRALPLMSGFEKRVSLKGDRGFESISLQRRVHREPDFQANDGVAVFRDPEPGGILRQAEFGKAVGGGAPVSRFVEPGTDTGEGRTRIAARHSGR